MLFDAVKSYFEYDFVTRCGIPQIQLDGTLADWQLLLERTKRLAQFNLDWWINQLLPILEQFIAVIQGKPDKRFWQSIYKFDDDMSAGPYISGWIIAFFPYLKDTQTGYATELNSFLMDGNEELQKYLYPLETDDRLYHFTTRVFPNGLATVPFHWQYLRQSYEMEFLAGFVGVKQNKDDFFLSPEIGWVVCEVQ